MDVLFYQKYGETAAALKAGKETAEMLVKFLKALCGLADNADHQKPRH